VDELVYQKGSNVLNWPNADEILASVGLKREEVTERMIEAADRRVAEDFRNRIKEDNKKSGALQTHILGDLEHDPAEKMNSLNGRWVSPEEAERRYQEHLRRKEEPSSCRVDEEVDTIPMRHVHNGRVVFFPKGDEMNLTKTKAVEIWVALGVKGDPKKWTGGTFNKYWNGLKDTPAAEIASKIDSEELITLIEDVQKALKDGRTVTVVDDEGAPLVQTATSQPKKEKNMSGTTKNAKASKDGKASSAKKAPPGKVRATADGPKDKYGSVVGTNNALVNKALGRSPLTFGQIVEKTGLTRGQVRYSHLDNLVKQGFANKVDKGWVLAK